MITYLLMQMAPAKQTPAELLATIPAILLIGAALVRAKLNRSR